MIKYVLAALALLAAVQFSLPAVAAQGGGRAISCPEQCDKKPCQASRAECQRMRDACVADCS